MTDYSYTISAADEPNSLQVAFANPHFGRLAMERIAARVSARGDAADLPTHFMVPADAEGEVRAAVDAVAQAIARDRLRYFGREMFGERWQLPLAEALGIDGRTVRFWTSGDRPVPTAIFARLPGIMRKLATDRRTSADRLESHAEALEICRTLGGCES